MKTEFWLTLSASKSNGFWRPSIPKASKNKPIIGRNAVGFKVTLDVPDSYFDLPELKAKITLPDIRKDVPVASVDMEERDNVSAWQPIETAPKDGTMILICLPRMMNLIVRARYDRVHNHWLHDYEGEGGIKSPYFYHKGDLWQPLPAAPDETKG